MQKTDSKRRPTSTVGGRLKASSQVVSLGVGDWSSKEVSFHREALGGGPGRSASWGKMPAIKAVPGCTCEILMFTQQFLRV